MTNNAPRIYPSICDNAPADIRFLTEALGFTAQEVSEGSGGLVDHALNGYDTWLGSSAPAARNPTRLTRDLLSLSRNR